MLPSVAAPFVGGLSIGLLTLNLLRVVHAGGGSELRATREESDAHGATYRPSLIPALVFALLAGILAQPAQIAFWPSLDAQVEEHRSTLIEQHQVASSALGTDADYYSEELEQAGFPIYRLSLIWNHPGRAIRLTLVFLAFVLLPALWSQLFAISGIRAYEKARGQRTRRRIVLAQRESAVEVRTILSRWPTFVSDTGAWPRRTSP